MAIESIFTVMTPPTDPFEAPIISEWVEVENKLGITLPGDYKEFIQLYGTGKVNDFIWIFNPLSKNQNINLIEQVRIQLETLIQLQSYGEVIPYKLFPEKGGILPLGMTDNGDVLFWKTEGSSNNWTILVNESRSDEWESFDMSITQFLVEILTHKISCKIFPQNFPNANPVFLGS